MRSLFATLILFYALPSFSQDGSIIAGEKCFRCSYHDTDTTLQFTYPYGAEYSLDLDNNGLGDFQFLMSSWVSNVPWVCVRK
jgi:hypothetical protein